MVSYLWCFTLLVCVLTQTTQINAQEIRPEDRSIFGNFIRSIGEVKLKLADDVDDVIGEIKSALGAGGGSIFSNIRQIAEAASSGMKNSDEAVRNGLEATKNAAEASYYAGRVVPKATLDLTNIGIKTLEDLIRNRNNFEE